MKAKFKKGVAEVVKIEDSDLDDAKKTITLRFEDGSERATDFGVADELVVLRDSIKNESLDTFMAGVEELQESVLETMIADSLVESYGNIAGYKLASCEYLDENLKVHGTVYFTSGKNRKLTYTFSESFINEDGKVSLQGLNEKLGADKQFVLAGRIDNKTLITESFKQLKK